MDENRRGMLLTLLDLAGASTPNACWDDRRAAELLRKEATADELLSLGANQALVAWIYSEQHAG